MFANALRQYFNYHFAENKLLWERGVMALTDEQFVQEIPYGLGSIRNHVVHLINVDFSWFHDLIGEEPPDWRKPEEMNDRAEIRAWWDEVIAFQKANLDALTDEKALSHPMQGEDAMLAVWQVLLHVANHGTDHRAQMLRILNEFGVQTWPQDYVFYLYDIQEK